jgi:hypothetical protein
MPKETQDGSPVSKGNTLLYIETVVQPTSHRCDTQRIALHRQRIFLEMRRCAASWIFFRLMQVYVIAYNEDSTGQNVTFHSGLLLEEDDYVILTKTKGT